MQQLAFQVNSDLQALDQVLANFSRLYQPNVPTKDWLQCQLALAEGFTNAVRHAHKSLPPETPIAIEIYLKPQEIEIRIWDWGPAFDLNNFLKNQDWSQQRLSEHGQGLLILQKIATHLSYTRSQGDRNCLCIVKQFSAL